ncbi:MAG: DUF5667 domain-containing protein [Dehalococcoidia bacterium]
MADRLDHVLQECLALLRQGVSLGECLARYPEDAEQLEPLLRTALTAEAQLTPGVPATVRTRIRLRILAEWDRQHQPRDQRWSLPGVLPRSVAVAASVLLVLVLSGLGTVAAAGGAVPGDPLYPVKEFREGAQLWLARSPEAKLAMYSRLVRERVEELRELTATGRTGPSSIALARLERHVTDVSQLLEGRVQPTTDGQLARDSGFLENLQEAVTKQQAAESLLQDTLDQAPAEARPGLRRALEAIQESRERVRAALEDLGSPSP